MRDTAIPAADTGLPDANAPDVNRRRLLIGLAAASTAAAAIAGATVPEETAELLGMPARVAAAVDIALQAEAGRKAIYEEWDRKMPAPPEDLLNMRVGSTENTEWKHIDGRIRYDREVGFPVRQALVPTRDGLAGYQEEIRRDLAKSKRIAEGKTLYGKTREEWEAELARIERLKLVADAWHAETARVVGASGYEAAARRANRAMFDALHLAEHALGLHATGMAGVVIKCQVIEAVGVLEYFAARAGTGGLGAKDSPAWQSLIAADVLRIAAAHGEA